MSRICVGPLSSITYQGYLPQQGKLTKWVSMLIRRSVPTQTDRKSPPQRPHYFIFGRSELLSTIKVYLAAIHNAHKAQGEHKRFMETSTPRLQQVMKGIQREQATVTRHRIRKPITISSVRNNSRTPDNFRRFVVPIRAKTELRGKYVWTI